MKISFNWLRDFIELNESPAEIAELLTKIGFETTVTELKNNFSGVVVGKVISKSSHPNADKLSVCEVTDGISTYSVVCGASNVQKGQLVPFAKIGATLGNLTIKKTKIRGVESEGMICSESELGISDASDGIMVLSDDLSVGDDFSSIYKNDYILESEVLPNRPDVLSHYGIALELSAKLNRPLKIPPLYRQEIPVESSLVKIAPDAGCSRYIAIVVDEISVGQSPEWLKIRLRSVGIRPINSVVDITNYCMVELGHPLHAFDYDTLSSRDKKIIVRRAKNQEKILALDSREYLLEATDIVIADENQPLAIAGIIGGENSSVTSKTKKIILESAVFDPKAIFNTRKRLKIITESSYRFERGMFLKRSEMVARRALYMLGGRVICHYDSGDTTSKNKITLFYEKIKKHTGLEIQDIKVKNILSGLSFEVVREEKDFLTFYVPDFRPDITTAEDAIEEIIRIYGYDNLKATANSCSQPFPSSTQKTLFLNLNLLRKKLKDLGFTEVVNYGMISDFWEKYFDSTKLYSLANPVSPDMLHMRPSLFCQMWENFVTNYKDGLEDQMLFEVGNVFYDGTEKLNLGLLCCGNIFGVNWKKLATDVNFYMLKGFIDKLAQIVSVGLEYVSETCDKNFMNFTHTIRANNFNIGYIGAVSENIAHEFDIPKVVWWAELNLEPLLSNPTPQRKYKPYSIFPSSVRDFSFVVPRSLNWQTLLSYIKKILSTEGEILDSIELVDVYTCEDAKKLPQGTIALTVRITLRHPAKTFTSDELNDIYTKLLTELEKLSIKLRT